MAKKDKNKTDDIERLVRVLLETDSNAPCNRKAVNKKIGLFRKKVRFDVIYDYINIKGY